MGRDYYRRRCAEVRSLSFGIHKLFMFLSNKRYYALKTPHLTWDCAIKIHIREIWEQWRSTVFGKHKSRGFPDLVLLTVAQR